MALNLWFSLMQMNQLTTVYVNRATNISTSRTIYWWIDQRFNCDIYSRLWPEQHPSQTPRIIRCRNSQNSLERFHTNRLRASNSRHRGMRMHNWVTGF
jgi:hypothetical protein